MDITVKIERYVRVKNHIKYEILLTINGIQQNPIFRRYQEFNQFYQNLKQCIKYFKLYSVNIKETSSTKLTAQEKQMMSASAPRSQLLKPPKLPGKKFFSNFDPIFLQKRRLLLEEFLNELVQNSLLLNLICTLTFLEIPSSLMIANNNKKNRPGDDQYTASSVGEVNQVGRQHLMLTNLNQVEYETRSEDEEQQQQHGHHGDVHTFVLNTERKYKYITNGVNDLIKILCNEPWWQNSFRIFQHGCGNGLFAIQLIYYVAESSNQNLNEAHQHTTNIFKSLPMSVIAEDANEVYINQFKEQIQLHHMSSKIKAIISKNNNGTNFSGVYDLFISIFALRNLSGYEGSPQMYIKSYFQHVMRIIKSEGYIVICEVANFTMGPKATKSNDGDNNWQRMITNVFDELSIQIIRRHRYFIRKPANEINNTNDDDSSEINNSNYRDKYKQSKQIQKFLSIPCVIIIGKMPVKIKRERERRIKAAKNKGT